MNKISINYVVSLGKTSSSNDVNFNNKIDDVFFKEIIFSIFDFDIKTL